MPKAEAAQQTQDSSKVSSNPQSAQKQILNAAPPQIPQIGASSQFQNPQVAAQFQQLFFQQQYQQMNAGGQNVMATQNAKGVPEPSTQNVNG